MSAVGLGLKRIVSRALTSCPKPANAPLKALPTALSDDLCQQSLASTLQYARALEAPAMTCTIRHFQGALIPAANAGLSLGRGFSTSPSFTDEEFRLAIEEVNGLFAEARDEIEMAMESKETVYFNEEADAAKAAVHGVLEKFKELLDRLDDERRGALQRSMGLKMEQLKGELAQLEDVEH